MFFTALLMVYISNVWEYKGHYPVGYQFLQANALKLVSTCVMIDPPNIPHFKRIISYFHAIYIYIYFLYLSTPHIFPTYFSNIFPSPKTHHLPTKASVRTMHGTTCCLQTPEGLQAQVPSVQAIAWRTQLPTNPVPAWWFCCVFLLINQHQICWFPAVSLEFPSFSDMIIFQLPKVFGRKNPWFCLQKIPEGFSPWNVDKNPSTSLEALSLYITMLQSKTLGQNESSSRWHRLPQLSLASLAHVLRIWSPRCANPVWFQGPLHDHLVGRCALHFVQFETIVGEDVVILQLVQQNIILS